MKYKRRRVVIPARLLRSILPENKHLDVNPVAVSIGHNGSDASPSYSFACNPAQGASINNRTGDAIKVTFLEMNLMISLNNAASTIDWVRMLVLKTRDPIYAAQFNTSIAACSSQIEGSYFVGGSNNYAICVKKLEADIVTIRDKLYGGNGMPTSTALTQQIHIKKRIPINQVVRFSAGSTTPAAGSVLFYLVANTAAISKLSGCLRWHYIDTH